MLSFRGAIFSNLDEIYISTDDEFIKSYIEDEHKDINKVKVIERDPKTATDIATTESVLLDF